jgi:hypothetical protein
VILALFLSIMFAAALNTLSDGAEVAGIDNTHFLHGFGLITHQILLIYEWEAQNILTRSISYDILGLLIMDMVY